MKKKQIKVNGKNVHIGVINPENKKTLILIHGLGSSHMTLERLAKKINLKDHRIIVFDLPGHYLSDKMGRPHTIKNYATFLNDLAKSLDLEKFSVLGHCLGAQIAIAFENKYPKKVEKLILITPITKKINASGYFASLYYLIALGLPKSLRHGWLTNMRRIIKHFAYMNDDIEMKALIDDMTIKEIKRLNADVITEGFRSIIYDDSADIIPYTKAKTYIIVSEKDFVFPANKIVEMYKIMPQVEFEILAEEGHLLVLDSPRKVAGKIDKWYAKRS